MSRTKLPKLQREILTKLYVTNQELEPITRAMCESGELKPWDRSQMLRAIFGLPIKQSWRKMYPAMSDCRAKYDAFSRPNASLTRSLRRLRDRGLISYECDWDTNGYLSCSVSLKYAGVEIARQIASSDV
jgi:hypothetical protein